MREIIIIQLRNNKMRTIIDLRIEIIIIIIIIINNINKIDKNGILKYTKSYKYSIIPT
jgi:hypothetical protein